MIRELVNRIIFEVVNQRDLDRSNDAMDAAADNAQDAARSSDRYRAAIGRLQASLRSSLGVLGRFTRGLGQAGRGLLRLTPIASAVSVAGLTAFGIGALRAAGDVEESRDKMRVALGDIAEDAERQLRRTSTILGVNRNQFREFVTDFALQLERSVGIDRSSELAQTLTERAFDLSSFENVDVQDVFTAFRAGINGSSEPLDRFNVNIRASAVEQFALANGLARTKGEIDENVKRYARLQLILRETNRAQGNLVLTANSFTNQQRRLRAQIQETIADIGREFIPTATLFLQNLNRGFQENRESIIAFFADIADNVESFIDNGGLERIAGLFGDIARFAGEAAGAVDRVFNISTRERQIEDVERQLLSDRNAVFNRQGVAGQIIGTGVNIRRTFGGIDRQAAESIVDARLLRQQSQPSTGTTNQNVTVNIGGSNASPEQITRAVRSGVNQATRKSLADVSVSSPAIR